MTVIGVNLEGVNDWTCSPAYINRMLMGRPPVNDLAMCDPITGLPTQAGSVTRVIALDPVDKVTPGAPSSHDYVILCDETVTEVRSPVAWFKPVKGRAVIKVTSPSITCPFEIHCNGPVNKFAFMRAEQEQGYLAKQRLNPDLLRVLQGWPILRTLDYTGTNKDSFPAHRPQLTDGYFWEGHGGIPAEDLGMLGKQLSAKLWYNIHHLMTDDQLRDTAKALAVWSIHVDFEWSNEFGWNFHKDWAFAAAAAHYGLAKASYFDMLRYYGWRAGQMAKIVASISPFFHVNLSSQASSTSQSYLPYILKGWDESGAPRSLIAGYANAHYLNMNEPVPADFTPKFMAMMAANNQDAFYSVAESKIPIMNARHAVAAAACKAERIVYKVYEANQSFYTEAPQMTDQVKRAQLLQWAIPLLHSERMANIIVRSLEGAIKAGAAEILPFNLSGVGSKDGVWGLTPHITQAPYPLFNKMKALNSPIPVVTTTR